MPLIRLLCCVAVLLLAACATGPSAEQGAGKPTLALAPQQASPGAVVTLRASGLPPQTAFDIGAGPPRSEYEIIGEAESDADGRLVTTVRVPVWARSGGRLIFVLSIPDSAFDVRGPALRVQ